MPEDARGNTSAKQPRERTKRRAPLLRSSTAVELPMPVDAAREEHTRARTLSHTRTRMHFPPFRRSLARSLGRSPLVRENGTHPGGFSSRSRPTVGGLAGRLVDERFCVATPRPGVNARCRSRIFAGRARQTEKRHTGGHTALPSRHKALTADRNTWLRAGPPPSSRLLGCTRPRSPPPPGPSPRFRGATWSQAALAPNADSRLHRFDRARSRRMSRRHS